jgi:ATP phosphoribosyltransferase regulatory subunit
VIHPVPPGTRDVLPDEMRELRSLTLRLSEAFEAAGYGEVSMPSIEYEEVLALGDRSSAGAGFRLFDDREQILALRSDATIPIARVVAGLRRHRIGLGDATLLHMAQLAEERG